MARKCHSQSCTGMRTAPTVKAWNWRMGPEWVEKPLMVQVAPVEANQERSHLLVVVAVGGAGGLSGGSGASTSGSSGASTSGGGGIGRSGGDDPGQGRKCGRDDEGPQMNDS